MANFPTLSRSPGHKGFTEELSRDAVDIANKASGLPVVNKLFTFSPKTWKHTRFLVSQADKETVEAHYLANCDVPFDWLNTQDDETYEIIYACPPRYTLDKIRLRWRIDFLFTQYSPL